MLNITIGFLFYFAVVAFWTAFFGTVQSLPWGLDEIIDIFMSQVNLIITILPPFATIWNVFIIGMAVNILLRVVEYVMWAIQIIRG